MKVRMFAVLEKEMENTKNGKKKGRYLKGKS